MDSWDREDEPRGCSDRVLGLTVTVVVSLAIWYLLIHIIIWCVRTAR